MVMSETSFNDRKYESIRRLRKVIDEHFAFKSVCHELARRHGEAIRRPLQTSAFRRLWCGENQFIMPAHGQ